MQNIFDPKKILFLDIEMPGMNGIEFLERLMRARPMPVVMFSSHTTKGSDAAIQSEFSSMVFSFITFFIGIPTAIKLFNWMTTMTSSTSPRIRLRSLLAPRMAAGRLILAILMKLKFEPMRAWRGRSHRDRLHSRQHRQSEQSQLS